MAKTMPSYALWSDRWEFLNGRYKLSAIHQVATFNNPEGFQRATSHFSTNKVPLGCSLHVFKQGIPPVYDHPKNCSGGHFKLQAIQAQAANELWGRLTEFFVTGQFPHQNCVNGITYMKKQHARGIKVWLSKSLDNRLVADVKKYIQCHLPAQQFINFKFCPHKYILQTLMRQSTEAAEGDTVSSGGKGYGRGGKARVWEEPMGAGFPVPAGYPGMPLSPWSPEMEPEDLQSFGFDTLSQSGLSYMSDQMEPFTEAWDMPPEGPYRYDVPVEGGPESPETPVESPVATSSPARTPAPAPTPAPPPAPAPSPLPPPPPPPPPSSPYLTPSPYPSPALSSNDSFTFQGIPADLPDLVPDPRMYDTTTSPLERLRERFSQLYADCPLPMTPVAYMSELLLMNTQSEAE